jgi:hypothetical protein
MSKNVTKSQNLKEIEKEAQKQLEFQAKPQVETEKQTEAQIEAETETRTPTLSLLPRHPFGNYEAICKLADQPFTIKTITDTQLINQIILAENIDRLQKDFGYKFRKWLDKRGKGLSTEAQEKQATYMWARAHIDMLARYVNGAFGIAGASGLDQWRFMLFLYKRARNAPPVEWPKIAEQTLHLWLAKPGVDPKALKASGHMVLKLLAHLTFA